MEFEYKYAGHSGVESDAGSASMSFVPDASREPTFLRASLTRAVEFREAISAMHDVVVQDLRWTPKDREAYKAWRAQQDEYDVDQVLADREETRARIDALYQEMSALWQKEQRRQKAFVDARQRYFDYIYMRDYTAWLILDPVITVHPDEVFFECFSKDESTYARLSAGFECFDEIDELGYGTTNIDYSQGLYDAFQKLRNYKRTRFEVDPGGFTAQTGASAAHREVKIDLPDSWVRGFLQVSSAMGQPAEARFRLHPMDVHNVCHALRRRNEKKGPRALRYELEPGEPVRIVLEPWEQVITCPRSIYSGPRSEVVRTWGRRRLHVLERLIPIARGFDVHLLGDGMPSFYVADLGEMSFTLGLSGWSANDWSRAGAFDLMAPREGVTNRSKRAVYAELKKRWSATPDELAQATKLERAQVLSALGAWAQAGRAVFDLNRSVWRARELSREPLPMDKLRFQSDREEAAWAIQKAKGVSAPAEVVDTDGVRHLAAKVKEDKDTYDTGVSLDRDGRLIGGTCGCNHYIRSKLAKGPCAHMLALRMRLSRNAH